MHDAEHAGDNATHGSTERLDRSYITPFDREDIHRLTVRLDDFMDFMDFVGAAVDLATLHKLGALPRRRAGPGRPPRRDGQADRRAAMARLATPRDLTDYWSKINELENDADQAYRRALSYLFSGELDTLTVMKLKEIIDQPESAADAFERRRRRAQHRGEGSPGPGPHSWSGSCSSSCR